MKDIVSKKIYNFLKEKNGRWIFLRKTNLIKLGVLDFINNFTKSFPEKISLKERVIFMIVNKSEYFKCGICHNYVLKSLEKKLDFDFSSFESFQKDCLDYTNIIRYCSLSCSRKSEHSQQKYKDTMLKKYGVSNISQLEEIKEKKKETFQKHYGVDNVSKSDYFRQQYKKTMNEKYGVDHFSQTEEFKEKIKQTSLERYGVPFVNQAQEIKDKKKETFLKRYGVSCTFEFPDFKETCEKISLERYGTKFPIQSKEIQDKIKQTVLKKYGVENVSQSKEIQDKIKQTSLERYGVNHFLQNIDIINKRIETLKRKYGVINITQLDNIKEKIKQTSLERYGVNYPIQSKKVKEKIKHNNLKKYGKEFIFQLDSVKEKIKQTMIERYGVINASQNQNIILKRCITVYENTFNRIKSKCKLLNLEIIEECVNDIIHNYKWKCLKCGYQFIKLYSCGIIPKCPNCFPIKYGAQQKEVSDFIKLLGIENIKINTRDIISPKELDIYLPDYKIAIEYNGLYWHSNERLHDPYYHLNKTMECIDKDIRLIHIFEDEWRYKQNIVKSRLKHILGLTKYKIYGRKCIIREIDNETKNKFLEKYHIQGKDTSKIRLGAFYKNRLVAVMTFGKPRYNKEYEYELIRFCTIGNFTIIGIANKLLKYFDKVYKPKNIISYADLRWSDGNVYENMNFILKNISDPNYFYIKYDYRENRVKYQKHKLKNLLDNYDEQLTEYQNMVLNGFEKIYDCGNLVFIR